MRNHVDLLKDHDIDTAIETFSNQLKNNFDKINATHYLKVETATIDDRYVIFLDLNDFINLLNIKKNLNKEFTIKLLQQDDVIKDVLIKIINGNIIIFTCQTLKITPTPHCHSFHLYSDTDIGLDDGFSAQQNIKMISKNIVFLKGSIETEKLEIACRETFENLAKIKSVSYQIKAKNILENGVIESETNSTVFAQSITSDQGFYCRGKLHITVSDWNAHQTSHLHAGEIHIVSVHFNQEGNVSAKKLKIKSHTIQWTGNMYVEEPIFQAAMSIKVAPSAQWYVKDKPQFMSQGFYEHAGLIEQTNQLEIFWKRIICPHIILSEEQRNLSRLPSALVVNESSYQPLPESPQWLPVLNKPDFDYLYKPYDKTRFEKFHDLDESKNQHEHSKIILSGKFALDFSGTIKANTAHIITQSNYYMNFSGTIFNRSPLHDLYFSSKSLQWSGTIENRTHLQITNENDFEQEGTIDDRVVVITTGNYRLKKFGFLSAEQLFLKAENKIYTEEDSRIIVYDNASFYARSIEHYGHLYNFGTLMLEAERYIYKRGPIVGGRQYYVAPFFLSVGELNAEQLSVISYLSIIIGLNRCGYYSNNSLITISPTLTLQTLLLPKNFPSAFLTLLNMGLSALSVSIPGAAFITVPTQIGLNAIIRAYTLVKMLDPLMANVYSLSTHTNSGHTLRLITQINQIANTLIYSAFSLATGIQNLSQPTSSPIVNQPPEFSLILKRMAAMTVSLLTGYNDNSLIKISPEIFVGWGENNSNFLSINVGAFLSLSRFDTSLFNFDATTGMTIGPANAIGYLSFNAANELSLIDQNYLNFQQIYFASLIFIGQRVGWNIQAHTLNIVGNSLFKNSHLSADRLNNDSDFNCVNSRVDIKTIFNTLHAVFGTYSSHVVVDELDNEGHFFLVNSNGNIKTIVNKDGVQFILSLMGIGEVSVNDNAFFALDASQVHVGKLKITQESHVQIRSSDVTLQLHDPFKWSTPTRHSNMEMKDSRVKTNLPTPLMTRFSHLLEKKNESHFIANYDAGILSYRTQSALRFSNETLYTCVPLSYQAPNISITGYLNVPQSFNLYADDLSLNHSSIVIKGNLQLHAEKTMAKASTVMAANIDISGNEIDLIADLKTKRHLYLRLSPQGLKIGIKKDQVETPLVLIAQSDVKISMKGNIRMMGVSVYAPRNAILEGHDVYFTRPILNHSFSLFNVGVRFNIPLLSAIRINVLDEIPLLQAIKQFSASNEDISRIVNGLNLSARAMKAMNHGIEDIKAHRPLSKNFINPLVDIIKNLFSIEANISVGCLHGSYPTLGHGDITANTIEIKCNEMKCQNAVALNAGAGRITADHVSFTSATLQAKNTTTHFSLSGRYGVMDRTISGNIGLNHASSSEHYSVLPALNSNPFVIESKQSVIDVNKTPVRSSAHYFSASAHLNVLDRNNLSSQLLEYFQFMVGNNGHEEKMTLPFVGRDELRKFANNVHWLAHRYVGQHIQPHALQTPKIENHVISPLYAYTNYSGNTIRHVHSHGNKFNLISEAEADDFDDDLNDLQNVDLFNFDSSNFHFLNGLTLLIGATLLAGQAFDVWIFEKFKEKMYRAENQINSKEYITAFFSGIKDGIFETGESLYRLAVDLGVLSAASMASQDRAFLNSGECKPSRFNCELYDRSVDHMRARWKSMAELMLHPADTMMHVYHNLQGFSGPERMKITSETITALFLPMGFFKISKMGINYHKYRMLTDPPVFIFDEGEPYWHDPQIEQQLVRLKGNQIKDVPSEYFYVIRHDGKLLLAPSKLPFPFPVWEDSDELHEYAGHGRLSYGANALSAGEIIIEKNGKIKVDNRSGHYVPQGDHLPKLTKRVFERNGLPNIEFKPWSSENPIFSPTIKPHKASQLPYGIGAFNGLLIFSVAQHKKSDDQQHSHAANLSTNFRRPY